MKAQKKHPTPKEKLGSTNLFIFIWNGYEWVFLTGPFQDIQKAECWLGIWKDQHFIIDDDMFLVTGAVVKKGLESPIPRKEDGVTDIGSKSQPKIIDT